MANGHKAFLAPMAKMVRRRWRFVACVAFVGVQNIWQPTFVPPTGRSVGHVVPMSIAAGSATGSPPQPPSARTTKTSTPRRDLAMMDRHLVLAVALLVLANGFPPAHDQRGARRCPPHRMKALPVKNGDVATLKTPLDSSKVSEFEDAEMPANIICARGVCVTEDDVDWLAPPSDFVCDEAECVADASPIMSVEYLWPRALLLFASALYGTNFPLGRIMNEGLPAAASTSARFVLAAGILSPFLLQLKPQLGTSALVCGAFTSLGYISQSIALKDTSAATVSFLGALTVVVVPAMGAVLDGRKISTSTAISAVLALAGVALLELGGGGGLAIGAGDLWSVLQAVGFGASFYFTEKMMAREPTQALPITAVQCAVVAALSACWALADGTGVFGGSDPDHVAWLLDESTRSKYALPGLFLEPGVRTVALAAAWTGFITTAGNRIAETTALGKMSSSEASVLLATEPLWAAAFGAVLIGETMTASDAGGGALIIAACLVNAVAPPAEPAAAEASD